MTTSYSKLYEEIGEAMKQMGTDIPDTMQAFGRLHTSVARDGALNAKTKELIALGIAIHTQCQGCIAFHVHDAMKFGATRHEILETVGVAILMGGGPSVVYSMEAIQAVKDFEKTTGTGPGKNTA